MAFFKRFMVPVIAGTLFVTSIVSCEEDFTTIGEGVISGDPFNTASQSFDVFAVNKNISAVQTNKLPLYQLGNFSDPVYGNTAASITTQVRITDNPTFGSLSQEVEDNPDTDIVSQIPERETVTDVFLYIPYSTNATDSDFDGVVDSEDQFPEDATNDDDGDGVSNIQEDINNTDPLNPDTDGDGINDGEDDSTLGDRFAKVFTLDSIYGREVGESFNFKVERSTFFLRDLDPNTNFQESQEYFSSQEFAPTFTDLVFFEGEVVIDDKEILFVVTEDNPDTDEDETGSISSKDIPGIRVPLSASFFQENFLDKEGSQELLTNSNFTDFFRGIHLTVDSDVMLLLDITNARIDVNYEYDSYNSEDEAVEVLEDTFVINLLQGGGTTAISGNAVNTLINDEYSGELQEGLDETENASRLYLKGGAGSYAEINLFDNENGREIIEEIAANNWIINEANIVFYVDNDVLAGTNFFPPRLYLYNTETNEPLYNAFTEPTVAEVTTLSIFPFYDGVLNSDQTQYKVRITEYINNLILEETDNPTLGLSLSANVAITGVSNTMLENGEEVEVPVMSSITPFGTVLFGSNVIADNQDKKMKLEIIYTEVN